jgi:hypothetical protein
MIWYNTEFLGLDFMGFPSQGRLSWREPLVGVKKHKRFDGCFLVVVCCCWETPACVLQRDLEARPDGLKNTREKV